MFFLMTSFVLASVFSSPQAPSPEPASAARLAAAIEQGRLAWQLSDPDEVAAVLGTPKADETGRDGGMEVRSWTYGDTFRVTFLRQANSPGPFVLAEARDGSRRLRLAPGDRLVLRTPADLAKLRPFTGLQNVDVSRLDLRGEGERLRDQAFDTRTLWPPADRLPLGFDPAALLHAGRNPGLGVRALHQGGIDGRGVTIGVIDQPLLPDHVEVAGRLEVVAELDVAGSPPQMHGPAVTSLAAGQTCGVAPGARIRHVSMAMWKAQADNALYLEALERLLALNGTGQERIRVVSISSGGFAKARRADEWRALLGRAEREGVLVITCDLEATGLNYGLLMPLPGGDRDKPEGYVPGSYSGGKSLLVPGDGRTFAHSERAGDYRYHPAGGMSWAAPYLAGLAALGFQVNPSLTPDRARAYLVKSATPMPYGTVVNPAAFVEMCRQDPDRPR